MRVTLEIVVGAKQPRCARSPQSKFYLDPFLQGFLIKEPASVLARFFWRMLVACLSNGVAQWLS